jgi:hypothetical protein
MGSDPNAPPASGSYLVHNDALTVNRRPLTTGAGDARIDGATILGNVVASDYLPLHWRGRPDAMQNRATAREQERPWLEAMQRYQTFWIDVLKDLSQIVFMAHNQYGSGKISDMSVEVVMQSPFQVDISEGAEVLTAIATAVSNSTLAHEPGVESTFQVVARILAAIGVDDPYDLLTDEQGDVIMPDEPEDEPPTTDAVVDPDEPSVDSDIPDAQPAEVDVTLKNVIDNYEAGNVSKVDTIQFLLGALGESRESL